MIAQHRFRATTTALTMGALTMSLGVACTPSSSATRAPRATADSAPEQVDDAPPRPPRAPRSLPAPVADDSTDPATSDDTGPVAAPLQPPPPPRVAARPVFVPSTSGPYRVHIVDANHRDLPTFGGGAGGRTYVMGEVGERYSIVIANPTGRRVEAVISIDGLDAMDGHAANYVEKRGYILPAYGDTTIDGFRTSFESVATFRFSSVADSYAGRLGHARDVGVIGVAFFPERSPVAAYRPPPPPPDEDVPAKSPARRVMPATVAPPSDLSPLAHASGGGGGAPSSPARGRLSDEKSADRPGLGTEFGEARESHIDTVAFARANPRSPSQVVTLRYNDRAGLVALGIEVPVPYASTETDLRLRETADPFRENRFAQPPP